MKISDLLLKTVGGPLLVATSGRDEAVVELAERELSQAILALLKLKQCNHIELRAEAVALLDDELKPMGVGLVMDWNTHQSHPIRTQKNSEWGKE